MVKENMLIPARKFFESEDETFKKELEIETILVNIACKFIKYRGENSLTQGQLAEKLGMSQAMVSKLESGDYNPTIKLMFEISNKLNWDFKIMLESKPDVKKYECEPDGLSNKVLEESDLEKMCMAV